MESPLLRKDMAKMMTNFAITVLGKKITTWATACSFIDMWVLDTQAQTYVVSACRLGLMWYESDGTTVKKRFDPLQEVDRGQFGTILSRILRWTQYNGGVVYYQGHLNALKTAWIMTKITLPEQKELRWWVMLMMQRATEKK
jgi:hypothetical protein